MKSIEVEGKTTKEAIHAALEKLGVTRDKVHVKILSEGHHGLFGMTGLKLAKVKVTLKEDTRHQHHKSLS
ncbi:MAG: Jag N-terminal domain-containing protein [Candidatus Omnitrophota bacterium]|jgi:spoIIIJ-associated protein